MFQPSLSGSFHETLVVSNVYDPNNDQVVTLKATISRAETFWLKSNSIDFGAVISGQWSPSQSFVFSNTSKQSRTFMLREVDCGGEEKGSLVPAKLQSTYAQPDLIKLRFVLEAKKHTIHSHVRPEQEAIEALERKALAYERKGKGDKVSKIRKEIEELKVKDIENGIIDKHEEVVAGEVLDLISETKVKQSPSAHQSNFVSGDVSVSAEKEKDLTSKNSDGFISFTLKPSESQVCDWILVRCL